MAQHFKRKSGIDMDFLLIGDSLYHGGISLLPNLHSVSRAALPAQARKPTWKVSSFDNPQGTHHSRLKCSTLATVFPCFYGSISVGMDNHLLTIQSHIKPSHN